jgi:hypothetical protein
VVSRDGVEIGEPSQTAYVDEGLSPGTAYSYTVRAVDTYGTASEPTEPVSTTTFRDPPPPPEVTFVDAWAGEARATTSLTVRVPTGAAPGDVVLLTIDATGGPTFQAPAGWVLVRRDQAGSALTKQTYYLLVTETTNPQHLWRFSSSTTASALALAYRGVDPGAPVVAHGGLASRSSTTTIRTPSLSVTEPGSMLVGFYGIATTARISPSETMQQRAAISSDGRTKLSGMAADERFAPVGATGTRDAVASRAGANVGHLVALRRAEPR